MVDKLPDLIKQAEEFPSQAEEVKEHAKPEFESLNPINKGKALAYFAVNMTTLAKVPSFIKGALENFKSLYDEIKEVIDDLKEHQAELKKNGEQCHKSQQHHPIQCYKTIFGAIQYSATERNEWERKNHGWHKGVHFEPETVPTTDMVLEEKKK